MTKKEINSKIVAAVEFVSQGAAERVDGDGYKVYRAGTIIRIDVETAKWLEAE